MEEKPGACLGDCEWYGVAEGPEGGIGTFWGKVDLEQSKVRYNGREGISH